MSIFQFFSPKPFSKQYQQEVDQIISELLIIGKKEDFLSEIPGGAFNAQCRHRRAREMGKRLDEIGGYACMEYVFKKVQRKLGKTSAEHLEFAWSGIGQWLP